RYHGRLRPGEHEARSRGQRDRGLVHDLGVRKVGVGEDHEVHRFPTNEVLELVLRHDRDALRVSRAGETRGVDPTGDVRDLRRRERDHLEFRTAPVEEVEVVEVSPGRTYDDDSLKSHAGPTESG